MAKPVIRRLDIEALIADRIREDRYIEYKRELPGDHQSEKAKFLHSVCSFANSDGGELIVGVAAIDGEAAEVVGIPSDEVDAAKLRIEQLLQNSTRPVPSRSIEEVRWNESCSVLVIKIPRSWNAPHRVLIDGQFHGRNSAGKYPMDIDQLRAAFGATAAIADEVEAFRKRRIDLMMGWAPNVTPVAPMTGRAAVLHCIPYESFRPFRRSVDLSSTKHQSKLLAPLGFGGQVRTGRFNLHGFLLANEHAELNRAERLVRRGYTQCFRSGAIESGSDYVIVESAFSHVNQIGPPDHANLPTLWFEARLVTALRRFLALQASWGVTPPIAVCLSLVGMMGWGLAVDSRLPVMKNAIDANPLMIEAVVANDFEEDPAALLRPIFDTIWNSVGYERCLDYNSDGTLNIDESWFDVIL